MSVFRTIELGAAWQPLSASVVVVSFSLVVPVSNAASVSVRVDGGTPAEIGPGMSAAFDDVDLSRVEVSGQLGDTVLVTAMGRARSVVLRGSASSATSSEEPSAPIAIAATMKDDASEATITFSEEMILPPMSQDPGLFRFRKSGALFTLAEVSLDGDTLLFYNVDDSVEDDGPNEAIMIECPPGFVGAVSGLEPELFNIPLTIV